MVDKQSSVDDVCSVFMGQVSFWLSRQAPANSGYVLRRIREAHAEYLRAVAALDKALARELSND